MKVITVEFLKNIDVSPLNSSASRVSVLNSTFKDATIEYDGSHLSIYHPKIKHEIHVPNGNLAFVHTEVEVVNEQRSIVDFGAISSPRRGRPRKTTETEQPAEI